VLRELVRVDLELAWRQGRPRLTEDYLALLPALREDPAGIRAVAFEEYRQRQLAGQRTTPAELCARLGVETMDWPFDPVASSTSADAAPGHSHFTSNGTGHETAPSVAQAVSALPPPGGEILGFRLERELGRGSFGRVYLAQQGDLADRRVVLKVTGATPTIEPRVLARLQHTNIVPVYSVHRSGLLQVLCMPYFGATTLALVVRELRKLPAPPSSGQWLLNLLHRHSEGDPATRTVPLFSGSYVATVLRLAVRLADGLAYAHEREVLHQDLKPANVLLGDDGQPMLLDFNLAYDSAIRATASSDVVGGTLPYMAPEHLEAFQDGRSHSDPRSDIYALGLILHELLTGQPTFPVPTGSTAIQELIDARKAGPPDVRQRNKDATPAVASILQRCLAPLPAQRYESAKQLAEDVERHLADLPLRWAPEPSWRERARKWARRHPRLSSSYLVAALAALLLVALGTAYMGRAHRLARAEAVNALHLASEELQRVRFLLGGPAPEAPDLADGIAEARRTLGRYRALEDPNWQSAPAVAALTRAEREQLLGELRELLLFLGRGVRLQAIAAAPSERDESLRYARRLNELAESCGPAEQGLRPVLIQRAFLLKVMGRSDEASGVLQQASELPVTTDRVLYLAAVEKMGAGDCRGACVLLQEARRASPQDAFVCYILGMCHAELGELARAAAALDASIALWPHFHLSHYQRARVHSERKEHADAVAELGEVLRLRPGFTNARIERALARLALKDYQGADSDLTAALASGTAPTRAWFIRAHVRRLTGDVKGAAADRAEGLKRQPQDDQSWVARGMARLANHQPNKALSDFDQALALNPRCLAALEDRAAVLSDVLGRTPEAIKSLDRAIELYPQRGQARAGRGVLLARLGKHDEALRDAREAERLDAQPANLYRVAGIYALASRDKPEHRQEAFRLLAAALRAGYGFEHLDGDPELEPLRALPQFKRLVAAARMLRDGGKRR
jgi:serine/threonine protein kinase/Tfp pilus assembly protein PilF